MISSLLRDENKRAIVFQVVALTLILLTGYYLYSNVTTNLAKQNIASGFGFFSKEAGFEISETVISFSSSDTYLKALLAGIANTIKVCIIGNFFAILLGIIFGIMRLSHNFLLAKISQVYVETIRNIPLLLQLFFWYSIFTDIFPSVRKALNPMYGVYFSNRGIGIPNIVEHAANKFVLIAFLMGVIGSFLWVKLAKKHLEATGKLRPQLWPCIGLLIGLPLIVWAGFGFPLQLEIPTLTGFNFKGGLNISPEFTSLLLGLVLYTSAFNAEIVRSGILSVKKGQIEAAKALGLKSNLTLTLVVLPQALRVIVPPLTSQILNLTKNSSLAVAIAYPDFVNVANTTLNQTGQALELISLIIVVYLIFSLITSLFMNWYNKKVALVER